MHNAGIDSMILYLSSSEAEQQWCLHVAEIIALLLREQVSSPKLQLVVQNLFNASLFINT